MLFAGYCGHWSFYVKIFCVTLSFSPLLKILTLIVCRQIHTLQFLICQLICAAAPLSNLHTIIVGTMADKDVNQGLPYHPVWTVCTSPIGDQYERYISVCWCILSYHMLVHWYGTVRIISTADQYIGTNQ